ncbi:MAG TPA: hypothetical protein VNA25_07600 [Phycisphaerae bacterium]|nr:hypothetical protein [Phycisphaerae bacterium]
MHDFAQKEAPAYGSANKVFTQEGYESAKKTLGEQRLTMGLDADKMKALIYVGGYHAEALLREIGRVGRRVWTERMRKDFPGISDPNLDRAWKEGAGERERSLTAWQEEQAGIEPTEEAVAPEPSVTSIKNTQVDAEREARGLPPAMQPAARTFGTVWSDMEAVVNANAAAGEQLVASLMGKPRPISDMEDALLLHRQIELQNEYAKAGTRAVDAATAGDASTQALAEAQVGAISDALFNVYNAGKAAGTETARGLNARKLAATEDFALSTMEIEARIAKGGEALTATERAEVQALHDRIAEQDRLLAEHQGALEKLRSDLAFAKAHQQVTAPRPRAPRAAAQPSAKHYGARNRIFTRAVAEQAASNVTSKLARLHVGIDPTIASDMAKMAGFHIEAGIRSVSEWATEMLAQFGKKIKPYLKDAWKAGQAAVRQGRRAAIGKRVVAKFDAGQNIGPQARQLARLLVEEGITERDALIDAVHAELMQSIPDITRRETMDAISGYGDYRQLSLDDIDVQLRDLKGQMQQVAKLEDMGEGVAPSKTGVERREPSNKERRLIKAVNEAKKRGGFIVTDPATQLRTVLDATKARLKHEISDLSDQLASREKSIKETITPLTDAELEDLRIRRNELRKQYREMFGGPTILTNEQRINRAETALERSIAEYERLIQEGGAGLHEKATPRLVSEKMEQLRARRAALQEELDALRGVSNPALTPEQQALKTWKARTINRIFELQSRLNTGNVGPARKTTVPELDAHGKELAYNRDRLVREWHEKLLKDRLARRSIIAKIGGGVREVLNTSRAIITSIDLSAVLRQGGFIALSRPMRAARALPSMFKALVSKRSEFDVEQEILRRPNYSRYVAAGLYLSEHGQSLAKMEEVYMSRWAEKIPLVAASQRAYTTFLNRLRADSFDAMSATLGRGGEVAPEEAAAIANYVNVTTGRGNLGQKANALVALNTVFFAPRYVSSRFQLLAGQPLYRGSARVRQMIAKEYGRFLIGAGVVIGLGILAGGDWEWDPRSSDFAKLRFGDTRVDPFFGLAQITVFLARLATGQRKTLSGQIVSLRGDGARPFGGGVADVIGRFLRSKLSPAFGGLVNVLSGENLIGEKVTPESVTGQLTVPLATRDIYEAMRSEGIGKGAALGLLATFGVGLQTYDRKPREKVPKTTAQRLYETRSGRASRLIARMEEERIKPGMTRARKERIRDRQRQMAALVEEGKPIFETLKPESYAEVVAAYIELYEQRAEALLDGKAWDDAKELATEETIDQRSEELGIPLPTAHNQAMGALRTRYSSLFYAAVVNKNHAAAVRFVTARMALGVDQEDQEKFAGLRAERAIAKGVPERVVDAQHARALKAISEAKNPSTSPRKEGE